VAEVVVEKLQTDLAVAAQVAEPVGMLRLVLISPQDNFIQ
jgi:hypothetical protein